LSADSAPLLAEVLLILRSYNHAPSDLADKWGSFCLNKKHLLAETDGGDRFSMENVRELKKHLQGPQIYGDAAHKKGKQEDEVGGC
jgi:hypothetical protein